MFVQIIHAEVKDAAGVEKEWKRWTDELMPDAEGFLGATAGITPDDRFFAIARFDSVAAAKRNSDRSEQGDWWEQLASHFNGDATFHESEDVTMYRDGGDDSAGFIQVMEGKVTDVEATKRMAKQMEADMQERRPDILGGVTATFDGNWFVDVVYFRSEAEAREKEKEMEGNPPPGMEEWSKLIEGDITFYDLPNPWLVTKG